MNREDLQTLSKMRRREAKALYDAEKYEGSYYLLGYAVECAVKAAIAKATERHDFPDKDRALASYTHNLVELFKTAGLWQKFQTDMQTTPALALNWAVVKDWNERKRYEVSTARSLARDFYSACTARTHGILSWLKKYW